MSKTPLQERQIAWTNQLEQIGKEHGFYEKLDDEHKALFVRGDDTLVVTFDNLDDARQNVKDRLPWGVKFINAQGWSVLGLAAHGWTWYRTDAVHDFFDRLRAEKFFDQFSKVAFYGTSMAGYAAAAFSSACPGSTVVALTPQATLDRSITGGWESRFRFAWPRDFSGRYSYAPDQVATAQKMWLFYDPLVREDAAHASLFRSPNVSRIRCRHLGHNMGTVLNMMGALKPITRGCIDGTLSDAEVYHLLRLRRTLPFFQKKLLKVLVDKRRRALVYRYCKAVLDDSHPAARPHFMNNMNKVATILNRPHYVPPS